MTTPASVAGFLLVVLVSPVISKNDTREACFKEYPGEVHVRKGHALVLDWRHTQSDVRDCFWEFDDLSPVQKPETVISCTGGVVYAGDQSTGWDVINKGSPCSGGIEKGSALASDAGYYKMSFGRLYSKTATVYVHDTDEMFFNVSIDNRTYARNGTVLNTEVPSILPQDKQHNIFVETNDKFPKISNISIEKHRRDGLDFKIECNLTRVCDVKLRIDVDSDVRAEVKIDTGLRDYPVIRLIQPFVNHVPKTAGVGATVAAVLFSLAFVAAISLAIYCGWKSKSWPFKTKGNKDTTDTTASRGLAMSYCLDYLSVVLAQIPDKLDTAQKNKTADSVHNKLIIILPETCKPLKIGGYADINEQDDDMAVDITPYNKARLKLYLVKDEKDHYVLIDQYRSIELMRKYLKDEHERKFEVKLFIEHIREILAKSYPECVQNFDILFVPKQVIKNGELASHIIGHIKKTVKVEAEYSTTVHGLAISYCHGFLVNILSNLKVELKKYKNIYPKLVILISNECQSIEINETYFTKDNNIKPRIVVSKEMKNYYDMAIYRLKPPNDNVGVVFEQPRILSTFNKMVEKKLEIGDKDQRKKAVTEFTEDVKNVLDEEEACKNQYVLIQFEGKFDENLAQRIYKEIGHSLEVEDGYGTDHDRPDEHLLAQQHGRSEEASGSDTVVDMDK